MNLVELPRGNEVFIDASILSLYFTKQKSLGAVCRAFLDRCASRELRACTSVITAAETIHRVIVAEAIRRYELPPRKAVTYLKQHPDKVKELREHLKVASEIYRLGVDILPVTHIHLHQSKHVHTNYGLMTNDSLIVAVMQDHKLVHLATNDRDFKRVRGIKVWLPAG
jgi:predicted nucleic acid-binding protein